MVSWGPGPWACAAGGALAAALAVVAALLVVVAVVVGAVVVAAVDGEPFTLERIVLVVQPGAGSWPWRGRSPARQLPGAAAPNGERDSRPVSTRLRGLWGSIASSPNTTVAGGPPLP
jgi:hypothetical protein